MKTIKRLWKKKARDVSYVQVVSELSKKRLKRKRKHKLTDSLKVETITPVNIKEEEESSLSNKFEFTENIFSITYKKL